MWENKVYVESEGAESFNHGQVSIYGRMVSGAYL